MGEGGRFVNPRLGGSCTCPLALWIANARQGVVSITSAISEGEKAVTKRLREAGMPLVVMLKDGFPPVGAPHERFFKPGGVYFDACAAGKLLLIEPYPEVLDDPQIVEAVHRKSPMAPRDSMRYHFLALNKVGEVISADRQPPHENDAHRLMEVLEGEAQKGE